MYKNGFRGCFINSMDAYSIIKLLAAAAFIFALASINGKFKPYNSLEKLNIANKDKIIYQILVHFSFVCAVFFIIIMTLLYPAPPSSLYIVNIENNYVPFVILPLYTTMLKMDKSQIEASRDLGANGVQTFFKVIIPMTMPGIVSAATMVFMPTLSSYVISDILSEYNVVLFGSYIDLYFNQADWNFGSFMALIMLLLIGISVVISRKFSAEDDKEGRTSIW